MMELDDTWLDAQAAQWRAPSGEDERWRGLVDELRTRHAREQLHHRAGQLAAMGSGAMVLGIAAWLVVARGMWLIPALSLLYVPLSGWITWRMEQLWRAKQAALADAPRHAMEAIAAHIAARTREEQISKRFVIAATLFTLCIAAPVLARSPTPAVYAALAAGLMIDAAVAYAFYVIMPRELAGERARYEALRADLEE